MLKTLLLLCLLTLYISVVEGDDKCTFATGGRDEYGQRITKSVKIGERVPDRHNRYTRECVKKGGKAQMVTIGCILEVTPGSDAIVELLAGKEEQRGSYILLQKNKFT